MAVLVPFEVVLCQYLVPLEAVPPVIFTLVPGQTDVPGDAELAVSDGVECRYVSTAEVLDQQAFLKALTRMTVVDPENHPVVDPPEFRVTVPLFPDPFCGTIRIWLY